MPKTTADQRRTATETNVTTARVRVARAKTATELGHSLKAYYEAYDIWSEGVNLQNTTASAIGETYTVSPRHNSAPTLHPMKTDQLR